MIAFQHHARGFVFCTGHTRTNYCHGCEKDKVTVRCIFVSREMYGKDRLPLCRECYKQYKEVVELAVMVGA